MSKSTTTTTTTTRSRAAGAGAAVTGGTARSNFFGRHDNVALYVPNLIGYARIACAAYAFSVALTNPVQFMAFYFFSFVCDELDGRFARLLGQSSTYGAVLDMVTDRLATACLLSLLCALYPRQATAPLFLLALDVASHWAQVAATAAAFGGHASHKDEGAQSASAIVRAYYSNRMFMGACCVSCEVLYLALYSFRGWKEDENGRSGGVGVGVGVGGGGHRGPPRVPLPRFLGFAAASVVNGVARALHSVDGDEASDDDNAFLAASFGRRFLKVPSPASPWSPPTHVPAAAVLALLALPGFAVKQAINWRQMRTAFGTLARHDVELSKSRKRK